MNYLREDESFRSFLARSLEMLRRDVPEAYAGMVLHLDGREVLLEVNGERVPFVFVNGKPRWLEAAVNPLVRVRTTRRGILDLIDGKSSLLDSVLVDQVEIFGSTNELISFYDSLMSYLAGALRGRYFADLLADFRQVEVAR